MYFHTTQVKPMIPMAMVMETIHRVLLATNFQTIQMIGLIQI